MSSPKLWEKLMKVFYTIIISFRTLIEFFSDFGKKDSQVFRNSNQVYRGKNVKKDSLKTGFSSFLDFDKKNLSFYRNFFGSVVKTTFYVSSGTLTKQDFWKEFLKTWGFWIIFEVFGTMAENFFSVGKTAIYVRGNSLWKFFFQKRNSFFFRLWTIVISSEIFCQSYESGILCIRGSFWGKTFFDIYIIFHTFSDFDPKNA